MNQNKLGELKLTGTGKRYKVLCPVTNKEGKTFWRLMGIGYPNHDGSTNLYLDGLPLNGKLQLREWDDPPWHKREAGTAPESDPKNDALPF